MPFPLYRPRRLRESPLLRKMVRETRLGVQDLVYPLFAVHGRGVREPIASMPGQFRLSVDELLKECKDAASMGIPAVLLFGLPAEKDPRGSEAYAEDGIIQQAVRAVKETIPDLLVITDVCLCEYTSHGHCGVVEEGRVRNDPTLDLLARTAVSQVDAGADMVAPSDMMDGRVAAIREALDENGNQETPIMAYSAKYASAFYGPFREAADSTPQFGDRRSYQMDPANSTEAMREVALDVDEGADIVMVKPALPYLDVIARVKNEFGVPVAAYSVSGEYAMLRAAGQLGWLDEEAAMMEALTGIRRAGADIVAPSDMMDGRVRAIRAALDANGFSDTPILSYAAKFAGPFYGPFRDAAESTPQFGDRRGYQMDSANSDEAIREVRLDIEEGADMVMVKPAGPFLDIIHRVKAETGYPVAAFQVSGEYAMIQAAAQRGWIDGERVMMDSLLGIRRAGADVIITYFAREAAKLINSGAPS